MDSETDIAIKEIWQDIIVMKDKINKLLQWKEEMDQKED